MTTEPGESPAFRRSLTDWTTRSNAMKIRLAIIASAAAFGLTLSGAALAGTAYVPLGSANEIVVIDTATDRVIRTISGVDHVHGLGGAPGRGFLIAGSFSETLPGEAQIGPAPEGMSEEDHAAHHAPPADGASGNDQQTPISILTVLNADDGTVVRSLEVPGAVHHVAVSPDGRNAVVTHTLAGGISVTDLGTFAVSQLIETGTTPNYAVFTSDGARAYVSNAGDGTVSEIDTHGWHVTRTMAADEAPEHMVLAPDDRTLYVANIGAGTVSVVSLTHGEVVETLVIGGELHGLDLSDDGKTLFVTGKGEDKLVAVDLASGQMRSAPLSPAPYHLAVVPGTGKLYVSSRAEPKIWVVDQQSLKPISVIPIRGEGHQMVFVE
jgi:YVTN family beta-propeller protein